MCVCVCVCVYIYIYNSFYTKDVGHDKNFHIFLKEKI